jgi:hypothetical protein
MEGLETVVLLGVTVLAGAILAPRLRVAAPSPWPVWHTSLACHGIPHLFSAQPWLRRTPQRSRLWAGCNSGSQ